MLQHILIWLRQHPYRSATATVVMNFIEKPPRGAVSSRLVNVGIYVLEPEALALIPKGEAWVMGLSFTPAAG